MQTPSLLHVPAPADVPSPQPQAPAAEPSSQRIGKFLVTPLVRKSDDGRWFASSVSIRSGSGSSTTDSVLRLTRLFLCAKEAGAYAHQEALRWIAAPWGRALPA